MALPNHVLWLAGLVGFVGGLLGQLAAASLLAWRWRRTRERVAVAPWMYGGPGGC